MIMDWPGSSDHDELEIFGMFFFFFRFVQKPLGLESSMEKNKKLETWWNMMKPETMAFEFLSCKGPQRCSGLLLQYAYFGLPVIV